MKPLLIITLLLATGCASDGVEVSLLEGLTPEQKMELAVKVIDARLEDGSDTTTYKVAGFEVFERERERDTNGN